MSMPLPDAPAEITPTDTPAPEVAPAAEELPAIHPSWQRALDDAAVPEMMRTPIIEQIRRTEAEYNKGIEKSRNDLPDEWRSFLTSAQQAGAAPADLTVAWNAAQAIREDPIAFLDNFSAQVDKLVTAGVLTRAEGAAAKADAADEVDDQVNLTSPEAQRIAALEAQIQQISQGQTAQQQAQAQAAAEADAQDYADRFMAAVNASLPAIGFTGDVATDPAAQQAQITVGRIADSMLAADTTGQLTPTAAIAAAINQVAAVMGRQVQVPGAAQLPVHGGNAAVPAPVAHKFTSEKDREAAMLEAAKQFLQ